MTEQESQHTFDIAVIGMSGRFPGAGNLGEFWANLRNGRESVTFFTDEELLEAGVDPELLKNPNYVKASAVLDGIDLFDARFFGYSAREAEILDPQQRLFLECAWEAMEDAGYDASRYEGPVGVFGGTWMNNYILHSSHIAGLDTDKVLTIISSDKDYLATRVSYKMNLRGPSISLGCACSTSLVAIHLACQSLLNGESDMALAGGVSLQIPQKAGYVYKPGGIPSPDGHCRAFDADAQGTVFGSGVGVVLLKRLEDAIADHDHVYAVVKGSAINNDGSDKVGYTAPSLNGQSNVILEAIANADVDAESIGYIEAHGTGTSIGDPIEIAALTKAFRHFTDRNGFCRIGSLKSNVGHLDVAAGVASFIKSVLLLRHAEIPPSLHFKRPNPEIDFEHSPFRVNDSLTEWSLAEYPRRAGVSSFGVGGTNAHIVLEEAPEPVPSGDARSSQLVVVSAKTPAALERATGNLADFLKKSPDLNLADAAFTLQIGRQAFSHRRALVARDRKQAVALLENPETKDVITNVCEPARRDISFIFSGQGSQYANMGLGIYREEPVFREAIDRCADILQPHLDLDLREIMYPEEQQAKEATDRLTQTGITQPALFTIEYALAQLWMSWGLKPQAMVGHSIGEYVAACLSGVFSLEDGLALVATRGRLMQGLPGGAMLAVFLDEETIRPYLNNNTSLAVINGPSLCVLSGSHEDIQALEQTLNENKVTTRRVHTSHAFHSAMMDPILPAFTERVAQVKLQPPTIPFLSNTTGTWITADEATSPAYWTRHLRSTVRFSDCLRNLLMEPNRVILEVGPSTIFSALAVQHPDRKPEHIILASTRHPKDSSADMDYILRSIGLLWTNGVNVDLPVFYARETRRRIPLPTYPFERESYWAAGTKPVYRGFDFNPTDTVGNTASSPEGSRPDADNGASGPAANVEDTLARIWKHVLGVKQVHPDDDFFELGGNSLIAVSMFAEIQNLLGKLITVSTLYQAPTFAKLLAVMKDEEYQETLTSLVEIQPGNGKSQSGNARLPLYLIHGGGGNVLYFRHLVRHLKPDQPIYGLQSMIYDEEPRFITNIEDMATKYVEEIRAIQPDGPYLLVGFCMGGTIALEMALQLQNKWQQKSMVVMLETYYWGNLPGLSFFDYIPHNLDKLRLVATKFLQREDQFFSRRFGLLVEKLAVYKDKIKARFGHSFEGTDERHLLFNQLEKINDAAANSYKPGSLYQGKIIHFVPEKEYRVFKNDPRAWWDSCATEGVEVNKVPVIRRQMLDERYVWMVAEKLNKYIDEFNGNGAASDEVKEAINIYGGSS